MNTIKDNFINIVSMIDPAGKDNAVTLFILDILLVTLIFYWIYLVLRETRGIRIVYGIFILLLLTATGRFLDLAALNFLLKYLSTMILVAIPVVLQPELRSFLERLGRTNIVADITKLKKKEMGDLIDTVADTVEVLSKNKVGALIVFERHTGLREYIENGILINGIVSTELLLTIFSQNTALHDGAVIINGNQVVAASCTLPLTDEKMALQLGTRHRAALGLTSITDALIIIVSEETGHISLAQESRLERQLSPDLLKQRLNNELNQFRASIKEQTV
ncbi:MAG: diadenylate cyclase CdaA [bacterium]|nr:diadenylate cyclase CdaA [bacterium]